MSPVPSGETIDTPTCATVPDSGGLPSTLTAGQWATRTTKGVPLASPARVNDAGTTVRALATVMVVMLASSEQSVKSTPNDDKRVTAAGGGPACATPPEPTVSSSAPT